MELVVDKMVTAKHGYVRTKELFDALCAEPQWSFTPSEVMMVVARLKIIPTADAVKVVRCKDCKTYDGDFCFVWGGGTDPDDFCSRGERK